MYVTCGVGVVGHKQGYRALTPGTDELTFQAPAQKDAMLLVC